MVRVVVPTEAIRRKFIELYGLDGGMIAVIPNGVDLRRFQQSPIPDSRTIIYVGTLAPHRSEFLSEVIREVCSRDRTVRFLIVGDRRFGEEPDAAPVGYDAERSPPCPARHPDLLPSPEAVG